MPRADGRKDPGPCERRIDGDRVTEMVPVEEWLAQKTKNELMLDPDRISPPRLPRYKERDHLHDNTRENAVFDPANPGLTQYVRVTRRINVNHAEEERLMKRREELRKADLDAEARDQKEKNEILELRSLGLRTAMAKYGPQARDENDGGRAHTHGMVTRSQAGSAFFM
jgi:hypothetical protein